MKGNYYANTASLGRGFLQPIPAYVDQNHPTLGAHLDPADPTGTAPFAVPGLDPAVLADSNMANLVQQTLHGLNTMHPSVIHALQYQQLLDNMRTVQFLAQHPNIQQILELASQPTAYMDAVTAAASAMNLQGGGMSQAQAQVSMAAGATENNEGNLPNYGDPLFASSAAAAVQTLAGSFAAPHASSASPLSSYDPADSPHPQQEDDYDALEEERKPYGQRCLLYLVEERHWVEALQRISTHPHEASMVGMQGRAPIHLACDHDAPAFLVHALLKVWPEGADMVGTSYMNPLHITCSSQHASNEIVNLLLSGCCDPLRITGAKDVDGDTPLHAACRCAAPIDVLATLLQTNPDIVMWHDYEGLNPLLRLWVRYYVILGEPAISSITTASDLTAELVEAWQKSLLLLRVMNEVHKKTVSGRGASRHPEGPVPFRAVHAASAVECPRCVLRIATILYPDQLMIPDEDGCLPLHIAAKAPVYRVHDLGGEGFSIDDAVFDDYEVNRRHSAIQLGEVIYSHKKDDDVCENPLNEPSVIDILLGVARSAARVPDPNGRLPLHAAIGSGKAFDQGVRGLVNAHPEALFIPDVETKLYPFMLAATAGADKKSCSTIFELMKLTPELVKMGLTCDFASDMDLKPKAKKC
ncbi:hypothetical protein HJC23_011316 [Cyclotella cryptica]|uniref:Uncharacterized protein n=1 Tax=Cyclotella cryptica TaxID=29204 RepID=A0ABD3QVY0_9STRA